MIEPEALSMSLLVAVRAGAAGCVKRLVEHGADVNARDETGSSALMIAAEHGLLEGVPMFDRGRSGPGNGA